MAIITLPPAVTIKHVEWTLDQPAQVNRSEWTKARQVVDQPGPAMWSATAQLVVAVGEDEALEAQAFVVDLEGQRNKFRLGICENPQAPDGFVPVVDGAIISARSFRLRGGTPGVMLRRGHKLTVNDQTVMLMAPVVFGGDGKATVTFKPSLRFAPEDGTAVEARNPTVLVALVASATGWSVDPGGLYQIKDISVEEAF